MADDVLLALAGAAKKKKRKRKRCRLVKRTKVIKGKRKVVKVRKCRPKKKPAKKPAPAYNAPAPAPLPAPPVPDPPAPPRLKTIQSPIAVYQGVFGPRQAERLAWRAGFGPRPGQVGQLAALDLEAAVMSFTRPVGQAPLDGPEPRACSASRSPTPPPASCIPATAASRAGCARSRRCSTWGCRSAASRSTA